MTSKTVKSPTLFQSFIPVVVLVTLLGFNVFFFGGDATYGSNQIALILAGSVAAIIGLKLGFKWKFIEDGIVSSISSAMQAMLILLIIGALAGTWLISGIIPMLISYGTSLLSPTFFLVTACILSALISLSTGSSWSTIATIGVALLGIGNALGIDEGLSAGAIISGAYFGDKMSPLSDTTNLAPAMAGTELFKHIKYMTYTTIPSILITLILFLLIGLFAIDGSANTDSQFIIDAINKKFNITPLLLIVPLAVGYIIYKKVPALPALLIGSLLGAVFALIFQPNIVKEIAGTNYGFVSDSYVGVMKAIFSEISVPIESGSESVTLMLNKLLNAKGMVGMMNTIWLIMTAMIFGGAMEACGFLKRITESIIGLAHSTGSLIASTVGTCFFFNITASDQYLAIVVPGRMYADTYRKRGLAPENLSRTLEDSGTVTSVLVPWNTCGAAQSAALKVDTLTYLPYCFFNIISPFMSIVFAYLNIKISRIEDKKEE
jgi:Na+:H+ antiporter, NhaC family